MFSTVKYVQNILRNIFFGLFAHWCVYWNWAPRTVWTLMDVFVSFVCMKEWNNVNASVLFDFAIVFIVLCVIIWLAWWFCSFHFFSSLRSISIILLYLTRSRHHKILLHLDHTSIVDLCTLFGLLLCQCV